MCTLDVYFTSTDMGRYFTSMDIGMRYSHHDLLLVVGAHLNLILLLGMWMQYSICVLLGMWLQYLIVYCGAFECSTWFVICCGGTLLCNLFVEHMNALFASLFVIARVTICECSWRASDSITNCKLLCVVPDDHCDLLILVSWSISKFICCKSVYQYTFRCTTMLTTHL